ncbi:UPF0496 protein-like protein [Drosera capensis]
MASPEGTSKEGSNGGQRSNLNATAEYREVFRSSSYTDIFTKFQAQMGTTCTKTGSMCPTFSSSSSPLPLYVHLSDCLFEPGQDTVLDMINNSNHHELLIDYFDTSLEACNVCEVILRISHKNRANYKLITTAISAAANSHDQGYSDEQVKAMVQNLTLFASLTNPLTLVSRNQFDGIYKRLVLLLDQLTSRQMQHKQRLKFIRLSKRATGVTLRDQCLMKKRTNLHTRGLIFNTILVAKGVYILTKDLETMWRLAIKIHNDVEHAKAVAEMCERNSQCQELIKEAMGELNKWNIVFLEQLKEHEEHLYLRFLTIYRSRRQVAEEIMASQNP